MNIIRNLRLIAVVGTSAVSALTLAAAPENFPNGQSLYGQPSRDGASASTVDVGSASHVRVGYGDTLTFRSGGQQFSWTFNGLDRRAVDISHIAPTGFTVKPLMIHVGRNPANRR